MCINGVVRLLNGFYNVDREGPARNTHRAETWRYTQKDPEGNQYGFHGVFHGDPSPDAIVQTFEFEGVPGHVCLQTVTFAERGDATLMRTVMAFQSVEDRDQMVATDMERGVRDSGDRLDELFAKLAAA
jgi:hypothetical protein